MTHDELCHTATAFKFARNINFFKHPFSKQVYCDWKCFTTGWANGELIMANTAEDVASVALIDWSWSWHFQTNLAFQVLTQILKWKFFSHSDFFELFLLQLNWLKPFLKADGTLLFTIILFVVNLQTTDKEAWVSEMIR